jgi:small-conductance mechanosensitive channel
MQISTLAANYYHLDLEPFIRSAVLIVIGYIFAKIISTSFAKFLMKHSSAQQTRIFRSTIFYIIMFLFAASVFEQLGFHVGTLLGAAGIFTVAISFAAQTSFSNIISGIFMIWEKPFAIGDMIKIGDIQGEILSIDLLSVKIRTRDNTLARIPNEFLLKSSAINLSYFPIRRADIMVGVAYKENLDNVKNVLIEVANKHPLCLMEPQPLLQILEFADSAVNLQFSVWTSRENFTDFKTSIQADIKKAFDEQGIEIPFPSRTLYLGTGIDTLSFNANAKDKA